MTPEQIEQLVPGDVITSYNAGYYAYVSKRPMYTTERDLQNPHFTIIHGEHQVGDTHDYIVGYTQLFDADMKPKKGKAVKECSAVYCHKITSERMEIAKHEAIVRITAQYTDFVAALKQLGK